jgi:hypothetical protein
MISLKEKDEKIKQLQEEINKLKSDLIFEKFKRLAELSSPKPEPWPGQVNPLWLYDPTKVWYSTGTGTANPNPGPPCTTTYFVTGVTNAGALKVKCHD